MLISVKFQWLYVRSWGEKALKSAGASGRTSRSTKVGEVPGWSWVGGCGGEVIWFPPHWKLCHLRRGVTNKMALKVVPTNEVYESCSACKRPTGRRRPSGAQSWWQNTERTIGTDRQQGSAWRREHYGIKKDGELLFGWKELWKTLL